MSSQKSAVLEFAVVRLFPVDSALLSFNDRARRASSSIPSHLASKLKYVKTSSLSVSILLGTLVAMTLQTLYNKQMAICKALISEVKEIYELHLLLEGFPNPCKTEECQQIFRIYWSESG
jgi:hypothetical protein